MAAKIGILTGGGDCPGLNAVIRAVTRRSLDRGAEVRRLHQRLQIWRQANDDCVEGAAAVSCLGAAAMVGAIASKGTVSRSRRCAFLVFRKTW